MADVPLGMFLSGGIDSSAIAAVMSRMVQEPIKTFSVGFSEREANELEYARLVARTFGTNHHEIILTPDIVQPCHGSFGMRMNRLRTSR